MWNVFWDLFTNIVNIASKRRAPSVVHQSRRTHFLACRCESAALCKVLSVLCSGGLAWCCCRNGVAGGGGRLAAARGAQGGIDQQEREREQFKTQEQPLNAYCKRFYSKYTTSHACAAGAMFRSDWMHHYSYRAPESMLHVFGRRWCVTRKTGLCKALRLMFPMKNVANWERCAITLYTTTSVRICGHISFCNVLFAQHLNGKVFPGQVQYSWIDLM